MPGRWRPSGFKAASACCADFLDEIGKRPGLAEAMRPVGNTAHSAISGSDQSGNRRCTLPSASSRRTSSRNDDQADAGQYPARILRRR
jgi:hypothetical protein